MDYFYLLGMGHNIDHIVNIWYYMNNKSQMDYSK